uniref:Uncharacterized protein n=1 Tax=Klebsiella pneumoniae TaxID=573 RepID=Q1G0U2_KLEPN|nr:unknown [Klebsiella pneumoniae]
MLGKSTPAAYAASCWASMANQIGATIPRVIAWPCSPKNHSNCATTATKMSDQIPDPSDVSGTWINL